MQIINHVYQNVHDYCQDIPANTGKQMCYAFIAASAIELIFTGDPIAVIAAGPLSLLATAIHGFVTPLFKHAVNGRDLTIGEEMLRSFVAISITACVRTVFLKTYIIQKLFLETVCYCTLIALDSSRCRIDSTAIISVFPYYAIIPGILNGQFLEKLHFAKAYFKI